MSREHFDIDKIRKNWDRATPPAPHHLQERFAHIATPADHHAEARKLLERARALVRVELPAHVEVLSHFLDSADELIRKLDPGFIQEGEGAEALPSREELRAELHEVLWDLEDLLEVYLFVSSK